jgi:hypothetical protein
VPSESFDVVVNDVKTRTVQTFRAAIALGGEQMFLQLARTDAESLSCYCCYYFNKNTMRFRSVVEVLVNNVNKSEQLTKEVANTPFAVFGYLDNPSNIRPPGRKKVNHWRLRNCSCVMQDNIVLAVHRTRESAQ